MGKSTTFINDLQMRFIESQHLFFVASAPLDGNAHVNISPKGLDTLRVFGPTQVAYLDLTGSGVETIAHLRENGRIVLMFCSFDGPPRIVRVHGRGEAVLRDSGRFPDLSSRFAGGSGTGVRSVVTVSVGRVADSCGYGVPVMEFGGHRPMMD